MGKAEQPEQQQPRGQMITFPVTTTSSYFRQVIGDQGLDVGLITGRGDTGRGG